MALTPLDFPASPTNGQTYPNPPVTGQPTYQWDAATGVWLSKFALGEEYVQLDGGQPMTGLLTLSGNPTAPMHAATKSYVDSTEKGRKNYIINGAMMVSQENAATAGTVSGFYPADMFSVSFTGTSGALSTANNPTVTPGGSPNRLRVAVTLADAAVAAGDAVWITTVVEGLRYGDLRFGSAAAKTITIQFGVRAPAGTYCVAVRNGTADRSYVAEYVIAAGEANTDVIKSVTLTGDLAGTWAAGNSTSAGMLISWGLMVGGTYQTPAGSWVASNFMASSNQFNFMGTLSNIFDLFDVSLTEGTVAPPFQVPDYAQELAACQRYFEIMTGMIGTGHCVAATTALIVSRFMSKRASPTISHTSIGSFSLYNVAGATVAVTSANPSSNITATGALTVYQTASGLVAGNGTELYGGAGTFLINARL